MRASSELMGVVRNDGSEVGGYTCAELAEMNLPGGLSERGWRKVVAREEWPSIEVQAKGGKKGVKRVYTPPPALLELIRRHLQGEEVTAGEVAAARAQPGVTMAQVQTQGAEGEGGMHQVQLTQVAAHHDLGKVSAPFQEPSALPASPEQAPSKPQAAPEKHLITLATGGGKTLAGLPIISNALSAIVSKAAAQASWLSGADSSQLLALGMRTINRLVQESQGSNLRLAELLDTPDFLDAALRMEWAMMQAEEQRSE